jgi:predicted nucleic acid-binding protein
LTGRATATALERLDALKNAWHEIQPLESIRRTARRLLRVHELRAADSLQLAAALAAAEGRPDALELVSLDDRLVEAARREGFRVLEPS